MSFALPARLDAIAEFLCADLVGDASIIITHLSTLQKAQAQELAFFSNPVYKSQLTTTQAGAVILKAEYLADCPAPALIVKNPYLAYATLAGAIGALPKPAAGIHPTAVIADDCTIASSASIGPYAVIEHGAVIGDEAVIQAYCYIGDHSIIGARTWLWPRVTIYHGVTLGEDCVCHSGVVIGSDGFGFAKQGENWLKIPQLGGVIIGHHVDIGANTTIDRGAIENTEIGDDVILDNQIQIGHNVKIGQATAIAGCVAIAGSATIGKNCLIGGGACISGHLSIADGITITGMSGVQSSLTEVATYSSGMPVQETRQWYKSIARLRHLEELTKRVKALESHKN